MTNFIVVDGLEYPIVVVKTIGDFGYSLNYSNGTVEMSGLPQHAMKCLELVEQGVRLN